MMSFLFKVIIFFLIFRLIFKLANFFSFGNHNKRNSHNRNRYTDQDRPSYKKETSLDEEKIVDAKFREIDS